MVTAGRALDWYDLQKLKALTESGRASWDRTRDHEADRMRRGFGECRGYRATLEEAERLRHESLADGYVEVEIVPLTSSEPAASSLKSSCGIDFES